MSWKNFPEDPENYIGFVYIIRNLLENKFYIGKKQILKKTRLKANKTRKRDKIVWKDNDVEKYWGSSRELLSDIERLGIENFDRHVIECCKSKFHMTWAELQWQLAFKVLFDPLAYNGVVNVRLGKIPKDYVEIERNPEDLKFLKISDIDNG